MALSLANLKTRTALSPPRFLIYGPPGMGKSSLACEFPNPVVLDIERGLPPNIDVPHFSDFDSFESVMEMLSSLYSDDHKFGTVVVDTLDRLEPMLWAYTCRRNQWADIESPGYGKGYTSADEDWRKFLDMLVALRRDRGMAVVLLAHSHVVTLPSPTTDPYPSYDIRLHKRGLAMVQDEVDGVLFVNQGATVKETKAGFNKVDRHAEGGGTRWIYADVNPAFIAKNRYGIPPASIYPKGQGYASVIAPHLTVKATAAAA